LWSANVEYLRDMEQLFEVSGNTTEKVRHNTKSKCNNFALDKRLTE